MKFFTFIIFFAFISLSLKFVSKNVERRLDSKIILTVNLLFSYGLVKV